MLYTTLYLPQFNSTAVTKYFFVADISTVANKVYNYNILRAFSRSRVHAHALMSERAAAASELLLLLLLI